RAKAIERQGEHCNSKRSKFGQAKRGKRVTQNSVWRIQWLLHLVGITITMIMTMTMEMNVQINQNQKKKRKECNRNPGHETVLAIPEKFSYLELTLMICQSRNHFYVQFQHLKQCIEQMCKHTFTPCDCIWFLTSMTYRGNPFGFETSNKWLVDNNLMIFDPFERQEWHSEFEERLLYQQQNKQQLISQLIEKEKAKKQMKSTAIPEKRNQAGVAIPLRYIPSDNQKALDQVDSQIYAIPKELEHLNEDFLDRIKARSKANILMKRHAMQSMGASAAFAKSAHLFYKISGIQEEKHLDIALLHRMDIYFWFRNQLPKKLFEEQVPYFVVGSSLRVPSLLSSYLIEDLKVDKDNMDTKKFAKSSNTLKESSKSSHMYDWAGGGYSTIYSPYTGQEKEEKVYILARH
ncbi:hypothetical protein RFI_26711, partial [Reticulomyxa filosa]